MLVRLAAVASLVALALPARAQPTLREWKDHDGVTHLSDGRGAASVCDWSDPKTGISYPGHPVRTRAGWTHCTIGPTKAAREAASRLEITPLASGTRARVHETSAWDGPIADAAHRYNLPEALVRAIIVAESNFDPNAKSRVGAVGLMQLMPSTADDVYVKDLADPVQNIWGGTRYLRVLANQFGGDFVKTVAAYNAGPDAVRKAHGVPDFAETREYVKRVLQLYRIYKGKAGES